MSVARFASKAEATKARWFSRRHETSQPHADAREKYRQEKEAKQARPATLLAKNAQMQANALRLKESYEAIKSAKRRVVA